MLEQIVRGPLLIPETDGSVSYYPDGVLASDAGGNIAFAGPWAALRSQLGSDAPEIPRSDHLLLPPLLDLHTHISQHPIRGRFDEGVPDNAPRGRLVESLHRNVFPAEIRCADVGYAERVARDFFADTLSHGVVGGAAYMTSSAVATDAALRVLPDYWHIGLVLMNQHCPPALQVDERTIIGDLERLADRFGERLIITDRFALTAASPLRRAAAQLAGMLQLQTQTHLNEQLAEKAAIEQSLYPEADSYTDVYREDGLLNHCCILAHCIHMRPEEWAIVADSGSVVAHCPTSNLLLGSGVMPLDKVIDRQIPYAIATDVGASPTVSMLAEMARFITIHRGQSSRANGVEALYRATLAPARILGIDSQVGRLEAKRPMSFIEVRPAADAGDPRDWTADQAIRAILPNDLEQPPLSVRRVTLQGQVVFTAGD